MKSLLDCHLLPYFVLQRTLIAAAFFCIKTLILQNIFCEAFFHLLHIGTPSLRIQVVTLSSFWFSFDLFMVEVSPVQ